jgi:hydrogenase nickel incorporation protein HypA/HybF
MHELALAESILEISEAEARKHQASAIRKIKLRLGEFTGVVREALEFSFEAIKDGTLATDAELEIEMVPLQTRCARCNSLTASPVQDLCLICPTCESPVEILSGRELQVEYLELD